jgi:hypothetical protein
MKQPRLPRSRRPREPFAPVPALPALSAPSVEVPAERAAPLRGRRLPVLLTGALLFGCGGAVDPGDGELDAGETDPSQQLAGGAESPYEPDYPLTGTGGSAYVPSNDGGSGGGETIPWPDPPSAGGIEEPYEPKGEGGAGGAGD